jgi:uncharacterized protein (TIGR02598 family)
MKNHRAFSLVEVTLALGVSSFCLIALMGLVPVGLKSNQATREQAAALNVARGLLTDLQNVPASPEGASAVHGVQVREAGEAADTAPQVVYFSETPAVPGAQFSATPDSSSRYRVAVTMTPPAAGQRGATMVHVRVTWPAIAATPAGSVETLTALDRN